MKKSEWTVLQNTLIKHTLYDHDCVAVGSYIDLNLKVVPTQ